MKKAEQSEFTRTALLDAARELFTERGYAGTATEDIAQRAGVTRGALYYQFRDKVGLFYAVLDDLSRSTNETVGIAMQSGQGNQGDLWDQIVRTGARVYLDACLDPAVQRIGLIEAPAVLGWKEKRELDRRYGLSLISEALQALVDAGLIAPQPIEPLAHLVLSAVLEAAMYIARADDIPAAREEMGASLERFLDSLQVKG